MKIEIVEFYPVTEMGRNFAGTLHIYIIDTDQDVRGIFVKKTKSNWWFQLPFKYQYDKETNEKVKFPVISFTNLDKNKEFINLVISEGKKYIIENFMKPKPIAKKAKSV